MLKLGQKVHPYGEVAAVASLSGERYYFFEDKDGGISMMPADVVEPKEDDYAASTASQQQRATVHPKR